MTLYNFINMKTPPVFNPRVTPDPVAAERLEEKFQQAVRKFKPLYGQLATSEPPPLMQKARKQLG